MPSSTGLPSKKCPGIGFFSRAYQKIGVFQHVVPPTRLRLEFPRETGLILNFYHPVLLLLCHEVSIGVWLLRPLLGWGTSSQEEGSLDLHLPDPSYLNPTCLPHPQRTPQGVESLELDIRGRVGVGLWGRCLAARENPACRVFHSILLLL